MALKPFWGVNVTFGASWPNANTSFLNVFSSCCSVIVDTAIGTSCWEISLLVPVTIISSIPRRPSETDSASWALIEEVIPIVNMKEKIVKYLIESIM